MNKSKGFKTAAVLSLVTGVLLCNFSEMQECAEFLTDGPVWTHQFAHKGFGDEMREALYCQHPKLKEIDAADVDRTNWESFRDTSVARLGATLRVTPMSAVKTRAAAFTEPLKSIGSARG